MDLREAEYTALRATILHRGTTRIVLSWTILVAWGSLVTALAVTSRLPAAFLVPLLVLLAGFETITALHVGIERIGRFLQVFSEEAAPQAPRWETVIMKYGQEYPGTGGGDPLASVAFVCAILLNFLTTALVSTPLEVAGMGALHLALIARVLRARASCGRQRSADLERFRALASRMTSASIPSNPADRSPQSRVSQS